MTALTDAAREFLSHKRIAVAGVSRNGDAAANAIHRKLRDQGYEVYAVNPHGGFIDVTRWLLLTLTLAMPLFAQEKTPAAPDRDALLAAARETMTAVRYCAVITLDASGRPNARVVDAFAPDETMVVWFATNPKSRKAAEIRRDPRVTLYYFDPQAPEQGYVTIVGRARLVDDPAAKQMRWKEGWEAYWPDRGAGFLLVEVTPERLEILNPKRDIGNDPVTWAAPAVRFEPPR